MSEEKEEIDRESLIKWFSELNKDSGKLVGGKGANLGEIFNLKIPVPEGFVVTAQAYDYFIKKSGLNEKIKQILETIKYEDTKQLNEKVIEIRKLITDSKLPNDLQEEILESYEHLSANKIEIERGSAADILNTAHEPIFVAVRSSATTEDLAEASFAGQQDTYLNIKGKEQLLEHIKKCFASLFTARATYYRDKKGFKYEDASLAVVVQKMINADKSGVMFSKDPTNKTNDIILEAVWGLGEGIVSGTITPDNYVVSQSLELKSKTIEDKKIAIRRNSAGETITVQLQEERSKHQVLTSYEIQKLAEFALKLEEHYKKPQDIEFAIENGDIYIVQTRPITTIKKQEERKASEIKGEVILTGLAASPGIGVGKVKIIEDLDDLHKIQTGDVLVTKMTNPDMVVAMQKSVAIITNEGGMTAHAAIVSREMGLPCIVGTRKATEILKDGDEITVDGYEGKVYSGKTSESKKKEILPVTATTKTKIKVMVDLPSFAERASKTGLKKVGLTRIEGIIAESGIHPNYFLEKDEINEYENIIYKGIQGIANYFEELWIRTSDIRTDEYQNLKGAPQEKEANPMLGMHGIRYSLQNPKILKAELKALKRIAEDGKTIGILMPQVISVQELKKVKEFIKEIQFEKLKVGIMIETPAAVQIINDLCTEGIDFISFGTNDLTQYLLAVDRGNEQVQYIYNELNPAILYQLEFVIRVCKRNKIQTSICGQAGSKKEMVKFLVEKGIDSISVNADVAKEIAEYVVEIEKTLVKGTDQEPRQYQPEEKKEESIPREGLGEEALKEESPKEEIIAEEKTIVEDNKEVKEIAQETITEKTAPEPPKEEFVKPQKVEEEPVQEKVKEPAEEHPKIPGIQNLPKEELEEDIKAIEKEKQEYLKEHPEEKKTEEEPIKEEVKDAEPLSENSGEDENSQEKFDEEPEFKEEKEINKKEEDKVLDIF